MEHSLIPWVLFGVFVVLLCIRIPISISLGASAMVCLLMLDIPLIVIPQRIFSSVDSFSLMAIPMFIVAGNIMSVGGISLKLINVAEVFFGNIRGGLAITAILACAFFAALTGSGPATVIAIGSMVYPEMLKRGYPDYQMAGLVTVAGGLGPVIPPSIIMIIYCTLTNTSIKDLFTAGFLIGFTMMFALMVVCYWQAKKHNWPLSHEKFSGQKLMTACLTGLPALMMPFIVLGGIYGGIFTPTEAAAVAVIYSIIVSCFLYRSLTLKQLLKILKDSAVASSVVLFIIGTASVFAWLFTVAGISNAIGSAILGAGFGYWGIIFIMTVVLLIFGFFMEFTATVLLLIPLFFPLCLAVGIHPLQLGMIVTLTNVIGCMTPPVATNIFACGSFTGLPVEKIALGELPYLLTLVVILILVVCFPWFSTFML